MKRLVILSVSISILRVAADESKKMLVWIDCDNSAGLEGVRDVDDGLALIQAMQSDELRIAGISTIFGNAAEPDTFMATVQMLEELFVSAPPVFSGAGHAGEFFRETSAVQAMAIAATKEMISVLALGALTNVAAFLTQHKNLSYKIERIIFVGGRRPGQEFRVGSTNEDVLPDLNVEKDAEALKIVLESGVPIILTPFELSKQVKFTYQNFLVKAQSSHSPITQYVFRVAEPWLEFWHDAFSVDYFNPYDCLAVLALTHPAFLACDHHATAALVDGPTDQISMAFDSSLGLASSQISGTPISKPYLMVHAAGSSADDELHPERKLQNRSNWVPLTYCYTPRHPHAFAVIIGRLLSKNTWPRHTPQWSSSRHPPHIYHQQDDKERQQQHDELRW